MIAILKFKKRFHPRFQFSILNFTSENYFCVFFDLLRLEEVSSLAFPPTSTLELLLLFPSPEELERLLVNAAEVESCEVVTVAATESDGLDWPAAPPPPCPCPLPARSLPSVETIAAERII